MGMSNPAEVLDSGATLVANVRGSSMAEFNAAPSRQIPSGLSEVAGVE